jgi:hypothetical protein
MPESKSITTESKADTELTPAEQVVVKFSNFAVEAEFNDAVDHFMEANCLGVGFEDVSLEDEQSLHHDGIFRRYLKLVDDLLESFCKKNKLSPETVSMHLEACLDSSDFLPEFLSNVRYESFVAQAKERAAASTKIRSALHAKSESKLSESSQISLSGVWKAANSSWVAAKPGPPQDASALDKHLKVQNCPYFARKILKHSNKFIRGIIIEQSEKRCTFTYKMRFLGSTSINLSLNDGVRVPNLWKVECTNTWRADPDDRSFRSVLSDEPYLKKWDGHSENRWAFEDRDGNPSDSNGPILTMTMSVFLGPGSTEPASTFKQYFVRDDDTMSSRKAEGK